MRKRQPKYAEAILWIAENDAPGDDQSAEDLVGYVSVALVADLFGVDQATVAKDVRSIRHDGEIGEQHMTVSTWREVSLARKRLATE